MSQKVIFLETQRVFRALRRMNGDLGYSHAVLVGTTTAAVSVFVQSWVVEPNLWWFRIQSFLLGIGAIAALLLLRRARQNLGDGLEAAEVSGWNETDTGDAA